MKITVDTNVLVRAAVQDDKIQSAQAAQLLTQATLVAIPLNKLGGEEFVSFDKKAIRIMRSQDIRVRLLS